MLNKATNPCAVNGFTINNELVVGFPICSGFALQPFSNLLSAFARLCESFIVLAPVSSARYSREREIANCISSAAIGVTMIRNMNAIGCIPLSLSPLTPVHNAILATVEITAASVAAIVVTSMSLFFTWESSCASTPLSSLSLSNFSIPSVHATTAFFGDGPVANAFGVSVGTMYNAGFGIPILCAMPSTILWRCGYSFFVAGFARYIANTSLCDQKYIPKFIIIARINAITIPLLPPII